ncbi:MAG: hypothetical protein ABFC96_02580 [Thermoguttaceae bacterium]
MKSTILATAGWAIAILVLCQGAVGQQKTPEKAPAANAATTKPTIAGLWQAESASVSPGERDEQTLSGSEQICNATVSEKQFTLRVGDEILAEMTYVLDTKKSPWTIDLKSKDGALLGICSRDGNTLKICANDAAKGRPAAFSNDAGLVLALKQFHPSALCVINADGSGLKRLLSRNDFTRLGSPDWSRDGRRIAFDGWKSLYGEEVAQVHLLTCNVDGSGFKDLGEGCMPSWSPDGRQLTFSAAGADQGVYLMNADGSNRRCIDPSGTDSEWSPKRNEIAYIVNEGGSAHLCIYDVATKQRRSLLEDRYPWIRSGMCWSPEGDWLALVGVGGRVEIAAVSARGEKAGFKVVLPSPASPKVGKINCTVSWGGSGKEILLSAQRKGDAEMLLYLLDVDGKRPPQRFNGYPATWGSADTAWSSDLKKVVFTASPP